MTLADVDEALSRLDDAVLSISVQYRVEGTIFSARLGRTGLALRPFAEKILDDVGQGGLRGGRLFGWLADKCHRQPPMVIVFIVLDSHQPSPLPYPDPFYGEICVRRKSR